MTHERVVIVEPDPAWGERYEAERVRLLAAVDGRFVELEHIGSTAVPGLAAKPNIDLLAAVASEDVIPELAARLEPLGYEHRPRIEGDVDVAYCRRIHGGVRTHHLHVVLVAEWPTDDRRRFRDILRARPDVAAAYAALKRDLASRYADRRADYTDAKTEFVASVLRG
jgi:GrpB-like predicted nucleotidyltransferase (UPF0157 family)